MAASWSRIIAPPEAVISARSAYYSIIDKLETPDPRTVIFHLKFATAAFLPALADPYAFIYKKELLYRDQHWSRNVLAQEEWDVIRFPAIAEADEVHDLMQIIGNYGDEYR